MNTTKRSNVVKTPEDMITGTVHKTNICGDLTIVKYKNARKVTVKFIGYNDHISARSGDIRKGEIKNPMIPDIYNKGFIGVGAYSYRDDKKAYTTWKNMLRRCYCTKTLEKNHTYVDCSVVGEWLNFQLFAEWFYIKSNFKDKLQLDKDLKVKGNKIYSSDTCLFIPAKVNTFLNCKQSNGKWGAGLSMLKCKKLQVQCKDIEGKLTYLGMFPLKDIKEAKQTYKDFKHSVRDELVLLQEDDEVAKYLSLWTV